MQRHWGFAIEVLVLTEHTRTWLRCVTVGRWWGSWNIHIHVGKSPCAPWFLWLVCLFYFCAIPCRVQSPKSKDTHGVCVCVCTTCTHTHTQWCGCKSGTQMWRQRWRRRWRGPQAIVQFARVRDILESSVWILRAGAGAVCLHVCITFKLSWWFIVEHAARLVGFYVL